MISTTGTQISAAHFFGGIDSKTQELGIICHLHRHFTGQKVGTFWKISRAEKDEFACQGLPSMDWFKGKLKPETPIFDGKNYGFLEIFP